MATRGAPRGAGGPRGAPRGGGGAESPQWRRGSREARRGAGLWAGRRGIPGSPWAGSPRALGQPRGGGRPSRRPGPGLSLRGRSRRLGPCAPRATLRLLLSHPRAAAPCNRVRPRSASVSASTQAKRRLGSGTQGCLCHPGFFFLARLTAAPASPGARVRSGARAFLPCSGGQPQAGNVTQSGWGRGVFDSARVQMLLCPGSDRWGVGSTRAGLRSARTPTRVGVGGRESTQADF